MRCMIIVSDGKACSTERAVLPVWVFKSHGGAPSITMQRLLFVATSLARSTRTHFKQADATRSIASKSSVARFSHPFGSWQRARASLLETCSFRNVTF